MKKCTIAPNIIVTASPPSSFRWGEVFIWRDLDSAYFWREGIGGICLVLAGTYITTYLHYLHPTPLDRQPGPLPKPPINRHQEDSTVIIL